MKGIVKRVTMLLITFLVISTGVLRNGPANSGEGGRPAPEITGHTWFNAAPMRLADLKGKVVLVEFWTFGCYNCRNVEPHVKEWHRKYADQGLVVIGVHTPETNFEQYGKN